VSTTSFVAKTRHAITQELQLASLGGNNFVCFTTSNHPFTLNGIEFLLLLHTICSCQNVALNLLQHFTFIQSTCFTIHKWNQCIYISNFDLTQPSLTNWRVIYAIHQIGNWSWSTMGVWARYLSVLWTPSFVIILNDMLSQGLLSRQVYCI